MKDGVAIAFFLLSFSSLCLAAAFWLRKAQIELKRDVEETQRDLRLRRKLLQRIINEQKQL